MHATKENILELFPILPGYRFIDRINSINENAIDAAYTFSGEEFFFNDHFPGFPVVPGAILQEAAAQVGLLAFGMYLLGNGLVSLSELPEGFLSERFGSVPNGIETLKKQMEPAQQNGKDPLLGNLFYLVSTEMHYKRVVRPGDTIHITGEKVFFRLNKLKSSIKIHTSTGDLIAKGVLSGMVISQSLWKIESLLQD